MPKPAAKLPLVGFKPLASEETPRSIALGDRIVHYLLRRAKRRTIGLRVPSHPIAMALLEQLGEPLMSVSLIMPGETEPLNDPEEIRERLDKQIAGVIDSGACPLEPTTVVDLSGDAPEVLRRGRGDPAALGL